MNHETFSTGTDCLNSPEQAASLPVWCIIGTEQKPYATIISSAGLRIQAADGLLLADIVPNPTIASILTSIQGHDGLAFAADIESETPFRGNLSEVVDTFNRRVHRVTNGQVPTVLAGLVPRVEGFKGVYIADQSFTAETRQAMITDRIKTSLAAYEQTAVPEQDPERNARFPAATLTTYPGYWCLDTEPSTEKDNSTNTIKKIQYIKKHIIKSEKDWLGVTYDTPQGHQHTTSVFVEGSKANIIETLMNGIPLHAQERGISDGRTRNDIFDLRQLLDIDLIRTEWITKEQQFYTLSLADVHQYWAQKAIRYLDQAQSAPTEAQDFLFAARELSPTQTLPPRSRHTTPHSSFPRQRHRKERAQSIPTSLYLSGLGMYGDMDLSVVVSEPDENNRQLTIAAVVTNARYPEQPPVAVSLSPQEYRWLAAAHQGIPITPAPTADELIRFNEKLFPILRKGIIRLTQPGATTVQLTTGDPNAREREKRRRETAGAYDMLFPRSRKPVHIGVGRSKSYRRTDVYMIGGDEDEA